MNPSERPAAAPLAAGLFLVATPIGNARDVTLRALDILAAADVLAAEDTRSLRRLMEIHGIPLSGRRPVAYHDHSAPAVRERLIAAIRDGRSVAYASEAGTPLVADPGYRLVEAARADGLAVTAAPGASAVLAALAVAGLPTDRFLFAGFPPQAKGARAKWLAELATVPATVVVYEAPGRVRGLLREMCETFGDARRAAVCRELTKRFEEVLTGSLGDLAAALDGRRLKGEVVVLVDRGGAPGADAATMEAALQAALREMSLKDAVASVAAALGVPRRQVYQRALELRKDR